MSKQHQKNIVLEDAIFYPTFYVENPKAYVSFQAMDRLYKLISRVEELQKENKELKKFKWMVIRGRRPGRDLDA